MRIAKNILLILGIILIIINILGFIGGIKPLPEDKTLEMQYKIAYFIGANLFVIVGTVFLLIAFVLNKKIKKRKEKALVDSLFKN